MKKNIIAFIFNHNHNENSLLWLNRLLSASIDAYIIDSGSDKPIENNERILKYKNLYYGGCFMEMCRLMKEKDAEWALQINDDILIDEENFNRLIKMIEIITERNDIGVYQPSTTEDSHNVVVDNINQGTGHARYTFRIEGWMGLIHKSILDIIYTFKDEQWRDGWGMDLMSSYLSWVLNRAVVVDDGVIVKHPKGESGYGIEKCNEEMQNVFKKRTDMTFQEMGLKTIHLFQNYIKNIKK